MMKEKKKVKRDLFLHFNSTQLKWLCFIFVALYTFSYAILQNGLLHAYSYTTEEFSALLEDERVMAITTISQVFIMLVGVVLPIYCMLLVSGLRHTRNIWKYVFRLAALALICEIPFDMCMYHSFWNSQGQNPIFTLVFCLIMIECFELLDGVQKGWKFGFKLIVTISAICWTLVLNSAFGIGMVLMTVVYYEFEERKVLKNILAGLIGAYYLTGPFAAYLTIGYTGEKGKERKQHQFYLLYFLQLLIFGIISFMM